MKTNVKFKWLYILILMLCLAIFVPLGDAKVYADTQITESDVTDTNLYSKLLKLGGGLLRSETFNKEKYSTINLEGVTTVDDSSNIVDISGLTKFKFECTKTLNLSHNNIKEVSAEVLSAFPNLQELILTDNEINSIDLSECYNLKKVILDNNKLTSIDLSDVSPIDAEIDLSCNYISSMTDITFPSQLTSVKATINLYNNNISDYESAPNGYTINLGLQGLSTDNDYIERKQVVTYYKTGDNLNVRMVIKSGDEEIKSILDSEITDTKTEIQLNNGSYDISYYYVDGDVEEPISIKNKVNAYAGKSYKKDYFRYYSYKAFDVKPSTPEYVYIIGNKEYKEGEFSQIKKKATIKVTADDDAKVYYSIAGGEWTEGREIPIKKGGSYQIDVKALSSDGQYESNEITIFINAASNLTFPDVLLVIVIILGAVLILAIGLPLLKKYVL